MSDFDKLPLPTEIECGSHKYKVHYDKDNSDRLRDDANYGETNHRLQTVCINAHRPRSQKTESLVHEALHIAETVFNSGSPDRISEAEMHGLSEGMAQILAGWGVEFDWPEEVQR